jgi:hypothetical protein
MISTFGLGFSAEIIFSESCPLHENVPNPFLSVLTQINFLSNLMNDWTSSGGEKKAIQRDLLVLRPSIKQRQLISPAPTYKHAVWDRDLSAAECPDSNAVRPKSSISFCLITYPQRLALASPTSGGRSVGIVRSRTKATELVLYLTGYTLSDFCSHWLTRS